MKLETKFDEAKKLVTFTLAGDIEAEDIKELIKSAEEYINKDLSCILDITGMEHIPTSVAKDAVDIATTKLASGFTNYCLVAQGMFMMMIMMFASESFKRDHLASSMSEAIDKLGL